MLSFCWRHCSLLRMCDISTDVSLGVTAIGVFSAAAPPHPAPARVSSSSYWILVMCSQYFSALALGVS